MNRRRVIVPTWARTIRFQVTLSLGVLFATLAGSAGYSIYALNLRRHDYEILNLSGQLRVTSAAMVSDARTFLQVASDTTADRGAEHQVYHQGLQRHMALYDKIITAFVTRRFEPELTGKYDAIVCVWDARSRSQLQRTADDWRAFRHGLNRRLGAANGAPDVTHGAAYVAEYGDALSTSSALLARAFQDMMEQKLATIRLFNQLVLALAAVIMAALIALLYRQLVRPLRETIDGFSRVARGDLGHQVPVQGGCEIGQMTTAFNQLSVRLNALFRLTDRIAQGNTLDETLRFVTEEFRCFLPLDWVGLFFLAPDGERLVLERQYGRDATPLREGMSFPRFGVTLQAGTLRTVNDIGADHRANPSDACLWMLRHAGFESATLLPTKGSGGVALLVFASRDRGAYTAEHVELIENVAGQLTHALGKTELMEGLVVSAVQGLAKLAESRDPDTGDHLARMALYAALIAEELGRAGPYQDQVSAAFVRSIHQFAPMHDIGKVGLGDVILRKPGRLSEAERLDMQRHPNIGAEVLRLCEAQVNGLGYSIFRVAIEIAEGHHERFDGTGYPQGLAGPAIPLAARIVAVADVFDALTSKRAYKAAWPVERALAMLEAEAGAQFDPHVVAAFRRALPRVLEVYERFEHGGTDGDGDRDTEPTHDARELIGAGPS
ncbi:MAG: HD domain-containing phosphohydrolase [Gemmatimonas sp.]|uniref:HD domain-containing phosphohydrolase n=1 Tax=Gemmatimonas sp. TaxID=1962908 RepID=UPI00391FB147